MTPTSIVAHLALFVVVGALFPLVSLLIGRFLRAYMPSPEKLETYECGEPAVGSSFIQFDLRFYVIALVFLVFEVEVAFFFPWATVFGKSTQVMGLGAATASARGENRAVLEDAMRRKYHELEARSDVAMAPPDQRPDLSTMSDDARRLALASMADMAVFFAVLLVGFAYVWYRGDLTWVRAVGGREAARTGAEGASLNPVELGGY
jgi:NADH-quinone oxidoreductase subunit A